MSSEETLVEKKTKVLIKLRGYKVLNKEEIKNAISYNIKMKDKRIGAIVVSEETEPRAREINEKRKSLGLSPLPIVTVKMVLSEDHYPISSTRIWFEEIDREGHLL